MVAQQELNGGRVATGVGGLDHILRGGMPQGMLYLIHGGPGTGKTTLSFQFLLEGVRLGERVLYASLLQTRAELEGILGSHGWTLDGIALMELPEQVRQLASEEQTLFNPAEVELNEMTQVILDAIVEHKPQRLVFDSLTELAVLVDSRYQLRRQLLKLKQQLRDTGCTTLLTVNDTEAVDLPSIQTVVHGVIEMGMDRLQYGPPRRWLDVTKMRGMVYVGGRHDFKLNTGGLQVYPRLEITDESRRSSWAAISSGNAQLDALFGGGLEEGTACLITGTTGAGKSTLASLYVHAAAQRGDRSVIFCFDERRDTFIRRSASLGLDVSNFIEQGIVDLRQINVGETSSGEFAHAIREAVDQQHVKVVVIDSISGYLHSMPEHRHLIVQLHEILSYLSGAGVLTLMIVATPGTQLIQSTELDTSYIADTVVLMRHFEAAGVVRRCISVLKKRHGDHEKTIREVIIGDNGVEVGPPLHQFRGVLTGVPTFRVRGSSRLEDQNSDEPGGV